MKSFIIAVLALSSCSAFNMTQCELDIQGLLLNYVRAVRDWNSVFNFRQAIQETGFAVQYLGAALIDCDFLPFGVLTSTPLVEAGSEMANYSGSETFEPLIYYLSESSCEEKLSVIVENAEYLLENKNGHDFMLQSLYDYLGTCRHELRLNF